MNDMNEKQLEANSVSIGASEIYILKHTSRGKQLSFTTNANLSLIESKANLLGNRITHFKSNLIALHTNNNIIIATDKDNIICKDGTCMFEEARFKTIDLTNLNTALMTSAKQMFNYAKTSKIILTNMITTNVDAMDQMFRSVKLDELDISHFDLKNVKSTFDMFAESEIKKLNISNIDTSNIEDMEYMFHNLITTNLDISHFNFNNLKKAKRMFWHINANTLKVRKLPYISYHNTLVSMSDAFKDMHIQKIIVTEEDKDCIERYKKLNNDEYEIIVE